MGAVPCVVNCLLSQCVYFVLSNVITPMGLYTCVLYTLTKSYNAGVKTVADTGILKGRFHYNIVHEVCTRNFEARPTFR